MDSIVESAYARMANMDPPRRGVARVRVRIVNKSPGHCVAGIPLEKGDNVIEVYADDLPRIEAQVEDLASHLAKTARDIYERKLREWEAEGGKPETAPLSLEACIRQVAGRDPKPFESVEVLGPVEESGKKSKGAPATS